MRLWVFSLVFLGLAGCTSSKCATESGCDTDTAATEEEEEDLGPVSVEVGWESGTLLLVEISGITEGTLGLAETGTEGGGWYLEDCVSEGAIYCHTVQAGTNSFVSVNERATGVEWDGEMDNNETLMHQTSAERITWAVFDGDGDCVAVGGHDPDYYGAAGCVNL
mgnify:CR=1 FL=1